MINCSKIIFVASFLISFQILVSSAFAFSYSASTTDSHFAINDTVYANLTADTSMNSTNVSVYLVNASGVLFNFHNVTMNTSANFSMAINVTASGDYTLKTNYTFNNTYYETSVLLKVSNASTFVISTDKSVYEPSGRVNFTVKATDRNDGGVSGESITVKMLYQTNDSLITSTSGTTNAAGEFSGQLTAHATAGTYRLVVNDWLATKVFDVSAFDIFAYSGDSNSNIKTTYGVNDTAFVFVDLFSVNKTKYTNTESVSVNVTYPNGTSNFTSYTYTGSKLNTSFVLPSNGTYIVEVQPASITRTIELTFKAQEYELRGSLESSTRGVTNSFFQSEEVILFVKVYNVSSGEVLTSNFTNGLWDLKVRDSNLVTVSTPSNSTSKLDTNAYRFNFTAPNVSGLYYIKVKLNDTEYSLDFTIKGTLAEAIPVDQNYNFKNIFVGNKQTVRVITILSNVSGSVNVTSISVMEVRNLAGLNVKSSLTINTSTVTYRGVKAGLVEFTAPTDAGWYFIKTLANNNFAGENWFLVKLYSICSQLANYKWFISSNETATLTLKVTEAKDIGFIESIAGNLSASNTSTGSFGNMYGLHDCYGAAGTTVSGSSTTGNATANIQVSVSKILNTLTTEDYTTKVSSLPSNTTDNNGQITLNITAPTNGWETGSYVVEFTLRDQNNNTDKGWGWFSVKNLYINIWPKQYSGYWKWYFSPTENFSLDVYSYNSSATWSYYALSQGTGDNCYVLDVFYQGDGAQWFWPPKKIPVSNYNWTCVNSSSPTNGRFNLNITPNTTFKTGYYMVRVKVNTTSGLSDTGEGWINVKAYNVYIRSQSANYYDSWYKGISETVNFTVEASFANSTFYGCYWSSCPNNQRVSQNINVTLKKITKYDQWQPVDYASSKYNATITNGTTVGVLTVNTTNGTVNVSLVPRGGTNNNTWEAGYYSIVIEVAGPEGTEAGNYWYEVKSFFVDITPVNNATGTLYKSSFTSSQNITVNVTAASKPRWMSAYNANISYFNATIVNAKLSYYSPGDFIMKSISVNYTPTVVNGTTTITIVPQSALSGGNWYNLEMTLRDENGNNQTGYASFQVKDFTVAAQTQNWRWEFNSTENISIQVLVCDSDKYWCNTPNTYSGSAVNVSVSQLYKTNAWPYTAVSGWSAGTGQATSSNNGTANLNISQMSPLSSGYYTAEISARYADGTGSVQKSNVWFSIKAFTFNANPTKWEFTMSENVTILVTANKALTLSDASISCGYWPDYKTLTLNNNLAANTTSIAAGTTGIKLMPLGTTWPNGYCYGTLTASDGSATTPAYIGFNMKAFTLNAYPTKYTFLKNQSVTVAVITDIGQSINISDISLSNYENWPDLTKLSLNNGFTINATNLTSNATINITPTSGTWPLFGYYSGEITAKDSANSNIQQKGWISFQIAAPIIAWGWTVDSRSNFLPVNTSLASRNLTFRLGLNKHNSVSGYYDVGTNVQASLLKIESENCSSYPCTYTTITDYTAAANGTSNSLGFATVNVTRSTAWNYGGYRATFLLNNTATLETTNNTKINFWVHFG